ncbi:N-acetyltransferase GCN5 [Caballeronia catudaia]|uniref:N-acetyltransferase GCN5 n=1 Tax=Caballeronia catudaia TaxID=1777136 RepID=A0A158BUQ2_9BURK|nr:GNAT family N-acetyltransferase [Caballeronia catudaia]SAK73803.1 N-acetyltransferase GCN5 [Caballeronia catudaia]
MLVRALTPEDAQSFQSLRLSALKQSPSSFASSYEDEKHRSPDEVIDRVMQTENQAVIGAFAEDRLIGIVGVRRDLFAQHRHKAHVWGMYVAPGYRGAGVSRTLMSHAIGFAKNMQGVTQVHLAVAATNDIAIRLYRSLGFEESGLADDTFDCDLCMCLRLTHSG